MFADTPALCYHLMFAGMLAFSIMVLKVGKQGLVMHSGFPLGSTSPGSASVGSSLFIHSQQFQEFNTFPPTPSPLST